MKFFPKVGLFLFFLKTMCLADPVLISLGENCNVAIALSQNGLRKQAFPFDWNVTPFHALFHVFSTDFSHFLNPECLFLTPHSHTVMNQYYQIEFAHDFPIYDGGLKDEHDLATPIPGIIKPDFLDALPSVQEKYARRIKRLYQILNGDDEILFIRHNHRHIAKDEVVKFCELIEAKFPLLKFTLVLWGYEDEMREDWGHPRIKTYQLIREKVGIDDFYENLFRSLNLIH